MRLKKLVDSLRKRFIISAVLFLVLGFLITVPNPITHECIPTLRQQLGVTDGTGYPSDKSFCQEGFQPQLKFGLESTYRNSTIFIFAVPYIVLPIAAALYIYHARRK